ncbi:cytochrome P450 monooxygenase [Daldinia vernicosa]|uniref:cytochrome P450 monooxygenase n=1 Tax=Daldinia vernicosa TaxID=114800 RepID=UPI0020076674|nr:cytochrome P450 monooxygenase [Daldinia vernicosa]KAI0853287.1 cytochrome P450 monooxygenase [Daldinia vernicosa]
MTLLSIDKISPPSLVGACVGFASLFSVWYIITTIVAWYRLRHVPGPFLASLSHLWVAKSIVFGTIQNDFSGLGTKYGTVVRVAPNYILTSDPEILRRIASARSNYGKDEWYETIRFAPEHRTMVTILGNSAHDQRKAKALKGYNGRENADLEYAIDSQIAHCVDVVRRKYLSGSETRPVDFASLSRYFTLDIITRLAYGQAFGFLDADGDLYEYTIRIDKALKTRNLCQEVPFLKHIIFSRPFHALFGPKPTDEKGIGKVMGITQKIIGERFKDANPPDDMMGSFIRHGMTEDECRSEAMLQILAGADTTAVAIRTTLMYIVATPRVYSRLKTMIRQCVERNEVSTPITYEEAQKLPYLKAIILEGIRMRSPAPYGHYKKTPPEGDVINGIFIPGGTAIGHNSIAMTRSKAIFGEDVEVFRPERFLEGDEKTKAERAFTIDIIFGNGRWTCAGKPIVMIELHKVFFEFLRVFDFQIVNPGKGWDENLYFVYFQSNMWVAITKAEKNE